VLGASAGGALLDDQGCERLLDALLPAVTVLTPNLPELDRLFGLGAASLPGDALEAALGMLRLALPCDLVLKGGHRPPPDLGTDLLVTAEGVTAFPPARALPGGAHGTGCTFASALTAALARGVELPQAVRYAKARVEGWIDAELRTSL
jgi:hydroxymethylpyrimidine/phosphomethylpyrimidine kinase